MYNTINEGVISPQFCTPLLNFSLILSSFLMASNIIFKRDGYVCFSAIKPPIKMKFWNIHFMDHLKRSLIRWLDGEFEDGEVIRRIQRRRTTTSIVTGQPECWWNEVKNDNDVCVMMHGSDEIVLTVVIS